MIKKAFFVHSNLTVGSLSLFLRAEKNLKWQNVSFDLNNVSEISIVNG